jgi:hypothetical protein
MRPAPRRRTAAGSARSKDRQLRGSRALTMRYTAVPTSLTGRPEKRSASVGIARPKNTLSARWCAMHSVDAMMYWWNLIVGHAPNR